MKIKQAILKIFVGILILFAGRSLLGGFQFSQSDTYAFIFIALFVATEWLTTRIRIFFLLPNLLPFLILLHTVLIFVLFYVANNYIGGISIAPLNPSLLAAAGKDSFLQTLGEFGTIGVVAIAMGISYQLINWLNNEK